MFKLFTGKPYHENEQGRSQGVAFPDPTPMAELLLKFDAVLGDR
jgi:hypothetical protein